MFKVGDMVIVLSTPATLGHKHTKKMVGKTFRILRIYEGQQYNIHLHCNITNIGVAYAENELRLVDVYINTKLNTGGNI